jgi:cytoskeletal protein CcmA (bactofilin family)
MRRDSFSKYSYFSDKEKTSSGNNIYFYSSDEISGPIHTNGTFKMSGSPTFYGHISSPNKWRGYDGSIEGGATPDFQGTTDFAAQVKELPSDDKIDVLKATAATDGLTFDKLSYIIMKSDGSIDVSLYDYRSGWSATTNYAKEVHKGLISTTEKIFLEGTVSGQITVHSEKDIELYDDIKYNVDPRVDDTSEDLLGVVSERDIIVDKNAHSRTGSKDLKLHGSFMALGDSFIVEDYSLGSFKGELDLLGGIIQRTRGAVGTFSRYGLTGFSKKYDYDVRLGNSIPPNFPRESVFTVVSWKERVVQNNASGY